MRVVKGKTGCWCSNCDNAESEYMIENNGSFKVFWARSEMDTDIAFCEDCARKLFRQLADALEVSI